MLNFILKWSIFSTAHDALNDLDEISDDDFMCDDDGDGGANQSSVAHIDWELEEQLLQDGSHLIDD